MRGTRPETDAEKTQFYLSRIENAINRIAGELELAREFPEQEVARAGEFKSDIEERRHKENLASINRQNNILRITLITTLIAQAILMFLQVIVIIINLKNNCNI